MPKIELNTQNTENFITNDELKKTQEQLSIAHDQINKGTGPGNDFLGWLRLPSATPDSLINEINETAQFAMENSDVFICIGIGGSYLGAKAAMEFANHAFYNQLQPDKRKNPEIYFAGHNISSDYIADLLDVIQDKRVCVNVISKSGTTLEPAAAFRVIKEHVEKRHGKSEAAKRIIATTDKQKGALKQLATQQGYKTFVIPDDVGGRFSVLTPVGLLPIAASGININELMDGAKEYEKIASNPDINANPAYLYSATRNILYRQGKAIELLSSFHPSLRYIAEWWKQLFGESEGKNNGGIFPASVDFTTDLHSMGQWIQEGTRIIFETFMTIEKSNREICVPQSSNDEDNLNFIAGKSLDYVNDKAYKGTAAAHLDGSVPNMTITLKDRTPNTLGQLFYFFEIAVAASAYLQQVNPFNQPGVEFYKKNMYKLLGKM